MAKGGLERLGVDVELIPGLKPPIKGLFQSGALFAGGSDKDRFPNVRNGF